MILRLGKFRSLKGPGLFFIAPITVVETMQLGGMAGLTALTMGLGKERAMNEKQDDLKKQE